MTWAKVLDQTRCIGCHACSTACKSENLVPLSVHRTFVKSVDVGVFPEARRAFQVTRCNQCADAPCAEACPTAAMYQRPDGIVDFDKEICIGCKACIAACPYDAIFINPDDHSAEKCNFCAHRIDMGLEPACVTVCPTNAIIVGDLDDPQSLVAQLVNRTAVSVRRPEKETHPKVFYRGAHQATLDPLAARRPDGGIFAWSEQPTENEAIEIPNTTAHAVLSYDIAHRAPWDWRVSLYTFTKGIAAGAYFVCAALVGLGVIAEDSVLFAWVAPLVALAFLGITGIILIADLEHPTRFPLIFLKRKWASWLVRGAFLITGYGALLTLHVACAYTHAIHTAWQAALAGVPLALMVAIYTAYLFAQSKGRDLWQSPLLPPHLVVQSALAGAAALLPFASAYEPNAVVALETIVAGCCLVHLLFALAEGTLAHPTAHARMAARQMTRGAYASFYWAGAALVASGVVTPFAPAAAYAALLGLLLFEHAYVQAGQSVPLA